MIYVLYHSNCYDGFGAAYAAWKLFGYNAKYIPVSYGYPPPEMPDAKLIYIVDFSYPKETLLKLAETAEVTVIDHHKTAEEALSSLKHSTNPFVHFSMEKSGALLTWEYFHKTTAPALIQHISDRDLWKFELDGSRQVHSALVSLPFDFETWDRLDVEKLKVEGVACERMQTSMVDKIVKSSWIGELDGKPCAMVNTSVAWSEVGEALLLKYKDNPEIKFAVSFTVFREQVMWSLRSTGDYDVSEIAKKFSGGGHKNAAGFKTARF